ncbi:MAG: ABC transporter permease [Chloroflexota bacterium]
MVEIAREPISATDTPLSPREQNLQRTARVLQIGAIAFGVFAALATLAAIIAGIFSGGLFETLAGLLLGRFAGPADTGVLVVILLCLMNLSALLVQMVGVLAQEFWAPWVLWLTAFANIGLLIWLGYVPGIVAAGFAAFAGSIAIRDLGAFRINPLMLKELRERMRGARAFIVMTVYLGLMSGFAVLLYLIETSAGQTAGSSATGALGRNLFRGVVGLELLLIVFIAPAFTSGAVSSERERKTYELLQITLLPHQSFVIGKLQSALGYVLLLLLAAIPLQSIAFLFGGVSQVELVLAFVILAVTAVTLGTVGLFFSTIVDRTLTASVRAYGAIFVATLGVPIALQLGVDVLDQLLRGVTQDTPALQAAFIYTEALIASLNPVSAALQTQELLVANASPGFNLERLRDGTAIPVAAPWISFTILYLTTASVLIVLAVRGLRQTEE